MQLRVDGTDSRTLLAELERRLSDDLTFEAGHILGSMCSSPDPIVPRIFARYIEKNIGDPGLFPATVALEREVVQTIGALLSGANVTGSILTGGTEANILAMWAAKRRAGKKRREVVLSDAAHFSFDKAADLMDLELVRIPVDETHRVRVSDLRAAVGNKTMAIVGIAGSTGLGAVDQLDELSAIALEQDLYYHVDAAFGGFVIPFLAEAGFPAPPFGFSLPGVSSITIDPHKMGRSAIPAGCLLFRDAELAQHAETNVTYLAGGETNQRTITGTRSGASVAAVWAVLNHLGRSGLVENVRLAMEKTSWFAGQIRRTPGISLVVEPTLNVVGIRADGRRMADVAARLRARGWAVSLFEGYVRVVVMPHVSREHLGTFLDVLTETIDE